MDNPLNNLLINIINYFIKSGTPRTDEHFPKTSNLVKIHSEKLSHMGDVSFPCITDIWHKCFPGSKGQLNEEAFQLVCSNGDVAENEKRKILEAARQWPLPVDHLIVKHENCHLFLQRRTVIQCLLSEVLNNTKYGQLQKNEDKKIYMKPLPSDIGAEDLSSYRVKLIHNVLQKLLLYSRWCQLDNEDNLESIRHAAINVQSVISKSFQTKNSEEVIIKCGIVTDPSNSGKLCQLATQDYLSIRSNDMTLMALHKYGIRVKQDARFQALMKRLGSAAVTVDLLEVKHTSPVQIVRNGQGSTKGASFILYNSARLETILRTFQERIDQGVYDPLPPIENIQWELFSEEEEWRLVYVYVAGFPDLIERSLEQLERGLCAAHLIIRFLHGLVATFSVYYRRIRILTIFAVFLQQMLKIRHHIKRNRFQLRQQFSGRNSWIIVLLANS